MLNPILASSALRRMRSMRTIILIVVYVAVLLSIALMGMNILMSDQRLLFQMQDGTMTYAVLIAVQFALLMLIAPAMTASSIAGERERQTLELLLVTNTSSLRIVFGKFMESFAFLALLIFSGLPVMCLTLLMGGVNVLQILVGLLFLLCVAFLAAGVGVLASSFMKNTVTATIVSYILLLILGSVTLLPLSYDVGENVVNVLYGTTNYATLTQMGTMKMLYLPLYVNPLIGLGALLESQIMLLGISGSSGYGNMTAPFLILNMAAMVVCALLLMGVASMLVRPKRVRIRKKS